MRKNKIFLIIPIILIIAVATAAIIYYLGYYTSAQQVYKRLADIGLDSCEDIVDKFEYNTCKSNISIDMSLETNNDEINDLVNNSNINLISNIDKENKQIIIDINTQHNNEELLNVKTYSNVLNKETYVYLKDFLNKYFKIDVNEKYYANLEDIMNVEKEETISNIQKLKEELVNIIKPEYCSSSKEEILIGDSLRKVTKDTLKLDSKEVIDVLKTVYKDIEDNKQISSYVDAEIEFNLYTTGLLKNNIEKLEMNIYNSEKNLRIYVIDGIYYYELKDNKTDLKGNISFQKESSNKGTIGIVLEENFGKLQVKLDYIQEYNTEMEVLDTTNSSDITNLSRDEQIILLENFEKSKLYTLITKLIVK